MNADQRSRLRALCEAATPGPWWTYEPAGGGVGVCSGASTDPRRLLMRSTAGARRPDDDAAFAAAARAALPALLDALDAAEARATTAERERDFWQRDFWQRQMVAACPEVDGMRALQRALLPHLPGAATDVPAVVDEVARLMRERDDERDEADALRDALRAANDTEHARRAAEWKRRHRVAAETAARWKAKAVAQSAEIHALHRDLAAARREAEYQEREAQGYRTRAEFAEIDAADAERALATLRATIGTTDAGPRDGDGREVG